MALSVGSQLGSHEIVALFGKGGMGEVYRARVTKLDRCNRTSITVSRTALTNGFQPRGTNWATMALIAAARSALLMLKKSLGQIKHSLPSHRSYHLCCANSHSTRPGSLNTRSHISCPMPGYSVYRGLPPAFLIAAIILRLGVTKFWLSASPEMTRSACPSHWEPAPGCLHRIE